MVVGLGFVVAHGYQRTFERTSPAMPTALAIPVLATTF
jgi:hypothetical protein